MQHAQIDDTPHATPRIMPMGLAPIMRTTRPCTPASSSHGAYTIWGKKVESKTDNGEDAHRSSSSMRTQGGTPMTKTDDGEEDLWIFYTGGAHIKTSLHLHRRTCSALRAFKHDGLAEWSKALASGASPQGRGFEPHSRHLLCRPLLTDAAARASPPTIRNRLYASHAHCWGKR
jgi:hypothetical protein